MGFLIGLSGIFMGMFNGHITIMGYSWNMSGDQKNPPVSSNTAGKSTISMTFSILSEQNFHYYPVVGRECFELVVFTLLFSTNKKWGAIWSYIKSFPTTSKSL